ncbi:uncharacterized protein EI90DRAFT_3038635 [Cantharellus anzutake]|uniref:uncharacterized protein n=1 Tax=Cantharellus anzutake TaxID=1750568 RepID=UPI001907F505|nr:uncharacterized protein EI90DRAFT_3038635 [Cantharellus anzutake]KAF8339962.1 hypothetical protein EI90DRAFT_3038635 [Cantharellus anzutake]
MRVECVACPIKISNAVRASVRAQECLQEVRVLAATRHTRREGVETAPLPKTRDFLSGLQSNSGGDTPQLSSGPGALASSTITSPTPFHALQSNAENLSLDEPLPITVSNNLGTFPFVDNTSSTSTMILPTPVLGLSPHVRGGSREEPILDASSLAYSDHLPYGEFAFPNFASSSFDITPHWGMSTYNSKNLDPTTATSSHRTANDELSAGPSRARDTPLNSTPAETYLEFPETRPSSSTNSDAYIWLSRLAQGMGYRLVPL